MLCPAMLCHSGPLKKPQNLPNATFIHNLVHVLQGGRVLFIPISPSLLLLPGTSGCMGNLWVGSERDPCFLRLVLLFPAAGFLSLAERTRTSESVGPLLRLDSQITYAPSATLLSLTCSAATLTCGLQPPLTHPCSPSLGVSSPNTRKPTGAGRDVFRFDVRHSDA